MNAINFPDIFYNNNTVVNTNSRDCTLENIKLILWSEKGEFRFDPFFGIRLRRYWYEQNDNVLMEILIDEIYEQLTIFIPQIKLKRKDISLVRDKWRIYANIKCRHDEDFSLNTYTLVLYDNDTL